MITPDRPGVLIVEDDYLVSESIKRCLNNLNFPLVGKASNGGEAIRLARQLNPDVILMDIKMPDMDGLTATRLIQEICPTPVVVLTAHESADLLVEASQSGASYYCLKPPQPSEIERAITIALARHNDLMELRKINRELKEARDEIKVLRGILPVCSSCKKIRDEEGAWRQIEEYIEDHSEVRFSHSLCRKCCVELYGDEDWFNDSLFEDYDNKP
jgi:CheY-like chemotaxis protein